MITDDSAGPKMAGAFFGRRKGHRLRPRQSGLLANALPTLAIDPDQTLPADLRALFDAAVDDVRLEIGFGGGEHLIAEAATHPRAGFIGSEPFINGMAKILAALDRAPLGNIRLHGGDATQLMARLPAGAIARIDLLYPDPWPKRRHWKRRFVQTETVAELARVLRPGGEFRFASDIPGYVEWTLARVTRSPDFEWTAERADDWRQAWPGFTRTRYEAKALREGRTPCYLIFRRR
jgi:tRNA (guanine-N7-)-methyltransferase